MQESATEKNKQTCQKGALQVNGLRFLFGQRVLRFSVSEEQKYFPQEIEFFCHRPLDTGKHLFVDLIYLRFPQSTIQLGLGCRIPGPQNI